MIVRIGQNVVCDDAHFRYCSRRRRERKYELKNGQTNRELVHLVFVRTLNGDAKNGKLDRRISYILVLYFRE